MFATIKSLIPEPRQADQPRHYVGRHRQPETVTARAAVPIVVPAVPSPPATVTFLLPSPTPPGDDAVAPAAVAVAPTVPLSPAASSPASHEPGEPDEEKLEQAS